jgi:hypothetical protein
MRQPWISFREPRSKIHLAQLSNDSHPANGPIPFCIGKLRLLYFPFSSPFPHLCVCLVRRLSCSCIISQMRGSHSQILMWLVLPCPELHTSQHKSLPFAAIHQTRPTLVAVPLFTAFPVSYMHISHTTIYIDAPVPVSPPLP